MADLPEYLTDQTFSSVMARLLAAIPDGIDKTEGSFIYDALAPAAIEFVNMASNAQDVLRFSFVSTTERDYLDLRADEHGLARMVAVKATGEVTFGGVNGTVINAGAIVSTSSLPGASPIEFETDSPVTISGGIATVAITAVIAAAAGNVAAATIIQLSTAIAGVTSVTNAEATSGGSDIESDEHLKVRYYAKVRNPSAGGNIGDYTTWAFEVPGVGAVRVLPVFYGPGTVLIVILDTDKEVPTQTLIDAVLDYISSPIDVVTEAEDMTVAGNGTSIDTTQTDDSGDSVLMEYNAGGDGLLTHEDIDLLLLDGVNDPASGIWTARILVKVDVITETDPLFDYGIWNVTAGTYADLSPTDTGDAHTILEGADLTVTFGYVVQRFYWNGTDNLETRIIRQQNDTVTKVWVDKVLYRSTFSNVTDDGLAPVGVEVYVEGAVSVDIDVTANLTVKTGYNVAAVVSAVEDNITAYLKSLALTDDNDVRYVRVGTAILDIAGVEDYDTLLVNGGTINIIISDNAFAVADTITIS